MRRHVDGTGKQRGDHRGRVRCIGQFEAVDMDVRGVPVAGVLLEVGVRFRHEFGDAERPRADRPKRQFRLVLRCSGRTGNRADAAGENSGKLVVGLAQVEGHRQRSIGGNAFDAAEIALDEGILLGQRPVVEGLDRRRIQHGIVRERQPLAQIEGQRLAIIGKAPLLRKARLGLALLVETGERGIGQADRIDIRAGAAGHRVPRGGQHEGPAQLAVPGLLLARTAARGDEQPRRQHGEQPPQVSPRLLPHAVSAGSRGACADARTLAGFGRPR